MSTTRAALVWAVLVLTALVPARPAPAGSPVLLLTEEAKPLSYTDGGRIKGLAADIVAGALDQAGIEHRMELLPWNRTYERARDDPGTFIFPIARIPERERSFAWIAPLAPAEVCLFRLHSRRDLADMGLANLPDLRVAAIRGYFTATLLQRWGVPRENVTLFQDDARQAAITHLEMGRSDFFLGDRLTFCTALLEAGKISEVISHGAPIRVGEYWLAAHPGTQPDILRRVGEAVQRFQSGGLAEAIRLEYVQPLQTALGR